MYVNRALVYYDLDRTPGDGQSSYTAKQPLPPSQSATDFKAKPSPWAPMLLLVQHGFKSTDRVSITAIAFLSKMKGDVAEMRRRRLGS